jgi:N-acetylmuramoyl-L-alanine amidase
MIIVCKISRTPGVIKYMSPHKQRNPWITLLVFAMFFCLVSVGAGNASPPRMEKIVIITRNDSRFELPVYRSAETAMIPVQDQLTVKFVENFGGRIVWLAPLETIVVLFPGKRDFRMKMSDTTAEFGQKTIKLQSAPGRVDGKPCIPLDALEKALGNRIVYNQVQDSYELKPLITGVNLVQDGKKYRLTISANGPMTYSTSILEDPSRYAIDIEGAEFDADLVERDLYIPGAGAVFIFQDTVNPQVARVTIPLETGARLEFPLERPDPSIIQADIITENIVEVSQVLGRQRITDLRVQEGTDRVSLKILTTGPVQYQWRRVFTPENRYIVDIPNTLYTAPVFNREFKVGYLKSIRVEQYRPVPDPVVRITVELHVPSVINIAADPRYSEINMEILSRTLNPRRGDVAREGTGIVDIPAPPVAVRRGIVITIDPGHGGGDPGAVNRVLGLRESDVTLDISLRLAQMLRKAGWIVHLTRTTDRDVTYAGSPDSLELSSRIQLANRTNSQLFVSIHIDASTSPDANGLSIFYGKDNSIPLARYLNYHLARANGRRNRGIWRGPFHVINNSCIPAVLVECAFISNYAEAVLLSTPEFRQRCAEGIYRGLMEYAAWAKLSGSTIVTPAPRENNEADRLMQQKLEEARRKIQQSKPVGDDTYRER